jgi:ABC-2 type transport system permease protein
MVRLLTDIKYSLIAFFRNKGAVFWTFVFPIILFVLLGFLFGGQGGPITLYYLDGDHSQLSDNFTATLNSTGALKLINAADSGLTEDDLSKMLKDGKISSYLVIPQGFQGGVAAAQTGNAAGAPVDIYYDKSQSTSMAVVSIVSQVADGFNIAMSGAKSLIVVSDRDVATSNVDYLNFLLPGIIGMSVMSIAVNGTVGQSARNRATGVFRKLATTPISRVEWNLGRIINQTIILLMSLAVSLAAAMVIFNLRPNINLMMLLMVIAGGAVFSGLGNIIAGFVKDEDTAANAASAMTFPLMFVSGSFFPVEKMPWFLQWLADVSPLTYLNNGLRSAMITGNMGDVLVNFAIVGLLGVVLFAIGVAVLKWKED